MKSHPQLKILNGFNITSVQIDDEGDLEVEFELPSSQDTMNYVTTITGSRSFDLYEDRELGQLCRQLFQVIQKRMESPDREREEIHCDLCASAGCCREFNILLTTSDIDRMRGEVTRTEFIKRYTVKAVDWTGDYRYQLKCDEDDDGEKCVFLLPDALGRMRCSVYDKRPDLCREYDMTLCSIFEPVENPAKVGRVASQQSRRMTKGVGRERGNGKE